MRYYKGLFLTLFLLIASSVEAQCAMCRAVLESSPENSMAEGINAGIIVLAVIPYVLVFTLIYLIWKSKKQVKA
ncbi:MAG: hypothetical protein RQ756_02385 [Flavobacteriaceae bacterium]|nr:hypothetical protein [Flavobacteriaceae bacterium]